VLTRRARCTDRRAGALTDKQGLLTEVQPTGRLLPET
jgi:hypothetical protein